MGSCQDGWQWSVAEEVWSEIRLAQTILDGISWEAFCGAYAQVEQWKNEVRQRKAALICAWYRRLLVAERASTSLSREAAHDALAHNMHELDCLYSALEHMLACAPNNHKFYRQLYHMVVENARS